MESLPAWMFTEERMRIHRDNDQIQRFWPANDTQTLVQRKYDLNTYTPNADVLAEELPAYSTFCP